MTVEAKVRVAVPDDTLAIMRLAELATSENAVSQPDMKKIGDQIWTVVTNPGPDAGICGVIGPVGGPLEGVALLRVGPLWYSNDFILEEKVIFVPQEFRKGPIGRAVALAKFVKSVSDEWGMPLAVGVLSNSRTRGKMRWYERHFGEPAGVYFLVNAHTGLNETG